MTRFDKDNISGKQKVAVILLLLGDELTAEIFKRLSEDEVSDLSREISTMGSIPPEVSETVLEDYFNMITAKNYLQVGGIEYAKRVLIKSLGPEAARRIIDRLVKLLEKTEGFSSLEKVSPQQLSKFIQNEHPQTIALILAHLSATKAADLMASLPEEMRTEVSLRMANLEEISPEIIKKIAGVLDKKLEALSSYSLEEYGGVKAVAELFNRMDRRASRNVLEQVETRDPELAASIRDMMFVFDDILLVDDQGIREILKRIDKKSLAISLKGSNDELKTKFYRNMSQRGAEMLKEEMEYLGPVRVKDVEKSQHEIVEVVRSLEEEGVIVIGGSGGDEYVV